MQDLQFGLSSQLLKNAALIKKSAQKETADAGEGPPQSPAFLKAPVGASWSEQRKAVQLKLSIQEAENTLHPLLVHDVQRQLIKYLKHMQQRQDTPNQMHTYYIPSEDAIVARSEAMLSHAAHIEASIAPEN